MTKFSSNTNNKTLLSLAFQIPYASTDTFKSSFLLRFLVPESIPCISLKGDKYVYLVEICHPRSPGPGGSKLTTSLVNVSLKVQT